MKDFFSKCSVGRHMKDFFTFTEEVPKGKLHFFREESPIRW